MNKTKTVDKGIRLVGVAYISTMGVTIITSLAVMALMNPHKCSEFAQTMLVLWGMIAVLFLVSAVVVGVVAWKIIPRVRTRWAIMFVHGVALLFSYVVIAFGLLVAFNC